MRLINVYPNLHLHLQLHCTCTCTCTRYLLDLLEAELDQPATQLLPHNLAGIMETAIRCTNNKSQKQIL